MRKPRSGDEQPTLFPISHAVEHEAPEPVVKQLTHPIWTENKARLVANYIYLFQMITKHGTYVDGFAGPQRPRQPEMWAAKLVLELEPKWLRHFYLFETDLTKCKMLRGLRESQVEVKGREIIVRRGDSNELIPQLLRAKVIAAREATFCLLDQQTFECHWNTVVQLAKYKPAGVAKIELFYFLAAGWFRRAVTAVRRRGVLEKWWGRQDWEKLKKMTAREVLDEMLGRFRFELLYSIVKPWPILDRNGRDMYYMIHATDHEAAPGLMARAYEDALGPTRPTEQITLFP
jgi:three-Cys-motif partner protein